MDGYNILNKFSNTNLKKRPYSLNKFDKWCMVIFTNYHIPNLQTNHFKVEILIYTL